jgi:hypothetical protein
MEIIAQRIFGHKDTALGLSLGAISASLKTPVIASAARQSFLSVGARKRTLTWREGKIAALRSQ